MLIIIYPDFIHRDRVIFIPYFTYSYYLLILLITYRDRLIPS